MRLDRILLVLTLCALVAVVTVGLMKRTAKPARTPASPAPSGECSVSLLVVGIEGLEPAIFEPMLREGRLPTLSGLLSQGALVQFPSLGREEDTRVVWTSLVTGVAPARQGVGGKVRSPKGNMVSLPPEPSSRTVDTIWTLLSKSGVRVAVLGWPGTWPVEQVNGLMVGPYVTYVLDRTHGGRPQDAVFPPDEYAAVDGLFRTGDSYRRLSLARFVNMDSRLGLEGLTGVNLEVLSRACAADTTMLTLARAAATRHDAAALFVFLPGLDEVSQRFWVYMDPTPTPSLVANETRYRHYQELVEAIGVTIPLYYEYVDEVLGRLVELVAPGGTVAVVVDHGYAGLEMDAQFRLLTGTKMHSESGMLVLRGPRLLAGARATGATLFDVAPTVMDAAGIQLPPGLDGRVLSEVGR